MINIFKYFKNWYYNMLIIMNYELLLVIDELRLTGGFDTDLILSIYSTQVT